MLTAQSHLYIPFVIFNFYYLLLLLFIFLEDVNPSVPTLSILTSHDNKGETCLAAGFYPKEGKLSLYTSNDNDGKDYNVDKVAVLSTTKTYYYAAFSEDAIETCKMNSATTNKTNGERKYSLFLIAFIFFQIRQ